MVYVPPGLFIYGKEAGIKIVNLKEGFFIDRHPVTHKDYAKFINAGGYKNEKYWSKEGWQFIKDYGYTEHQSRRYEEYPVVGIAWYEADAYARWAEKQLPTEGMWEKAARGIDGRLYPWGDEPPDKGRCNVGNEKETTPVNQYESGQSPYGAYDMVGNVLELCEDLHSSDNITIVLRGGSCLTDKLRSRASERNRIDPSFRWSGNGGFRCARTVSL